MGQRVWFFKNVSEDNIMLSTLILRPPHLPLHFPVSSVTSSAEASSSVTFFFGRPRPFPVPLEVFLAVLVVPLGLPRPLALVLPLGLPRPLLACGSPSSSFFTAGVFLSLSGLGGRPRPLLTALASVSSAISIVFSCRSESSNIS